MNITDISQLVLLDKYQPGQVLLAIVAVQDEILSRDPQAGQRITAEEALSLKPFSRLLKRLDKMRVLDTQEGPRRKPHRLRVEYDEMTALRLFYGRLLETTNQDEDEVNLRTTLGRFHQPSLNIERRIKLPAVKTAGKQTTLL